jgi:hypothetical protein
MEKVNTLAVMLAMALFCSGGCGKSSDKELKDEDSAMKKMYSPQQDKDVTSDPQYNFSSFAGTVWKTKIKLGMVDIKRYTGRRDTALLAPESFDSTQPNYRPPHDMTMISVLAEGTHLRIERLMEDQGVWGGVWVTASLEDGKIVYLEPYLLAKNRFIWKGWSSSTNWGFDAQMLEEIK